MRSPSGRPASCPRGASSRSRSVAALRISVLHLGSARAFHMGSREGGHERTQARCHFRGGTTVFGDPLALIVEDAVDPDRALIIGESVMHRILVTVFLEVRENDIRIISARRATRRERRRYGASKEG